MVENKLSGLEFFKTSRYLGDGVGWEVDQVISIPTDMDPYIPERSTRLYHENYPDRYVSIYT